MKRPVLPFVALYLAVALVSWAPATSASTHLGPDDRSDVSSLTVPGDNFLAVRIPLDYRGRLGLDFGRRARPGEQYTSAALSAELPGEALHCAGVAGRRVREVLATLDRRGVYAIWRDPGNRTVPVGQVLDRWVASTIPWAPGQVLFMTAQQPPDRGELTPQYLALLRRGCPGG
jgi:hypothetical protein